MTNVIFHPFTPNGVIPAPPSKSDVHRAVICAALSKGRCTVSPVALSEDIQATIRCVEALGAKTAVAGDTLTVDGTHLFENKTAVLDCRESGSTLRFLIPVAAAGNVEATFIGSGRLPERPIGIYTEALPEKGVTCRTKGGLPLQIGGRLQSGVYRIPGDVSSQFITGLLFALPLLEGDSDIILTSPIQSAGYINMTIRTMSKFGIEVDMTDKGWHIRGKQHYIPTDYTTDGDWSQAAFFLAAGAIGGDVTVTGCFCANSAPKQSRTAAPSPSVARRCTRSRSTRRRSPIWCLSWRCAPALPRARPASPTQRGCASRRATVCVPRRHCSTPSAARRRNCPTVCSSPASGSCRAALPTAATTTAS